MCWALLPLANCIVVRSNLSLQAAVFFPTVLTATVYRPTSIGHDFPEYSVKELMRREREFDDAY